jgi:hypothetical protein
MSGTPGLGAFNKDKVANKFGIQLKPKDASQRSSTDKKSTPTNVTKNKTIGDFRTDNSTNGFLLNTNRITSSKTPEPTRKTATSKSTSGLANTPVKNNEQSKTLISNVNHSTAKSPTTTKRSSITPAKPAISPVPPIKRPSITKTEAQIEDKKDQPLYRRQLSKQLDNVSLSTSAATTTTASPTSLKR